jgi:hypothetical protein
VVNVAKNLIIVYRKVAINNKIRFYLMGHLFKSHKKISKTRLQTRLSRLIRVEDESKPLINTAGRVP